MDIFICFIIIGFLSTSFIHVRCQMTDDLDDTNDLITDEEAARIWLTEYNRMASDVFYESSVISWNYSTNITEHNQKIQLQNYLEVSKFQKNMSKEANTYDWRNFNDTELRRQFQFITDIGLSATKDEDKMKKILELQSNMETTYSTGKVCIRSADNCLKLEPGLVRLFANSRDYDRLLNAWKGWRDSTGKKMKQEYEQFVNLSNQAVQTLGDFNDLGSYWLSWYETPAFVKEVTDIMDQMKPLYLEIHTYVREKLQEMYSDHKFPETGHIPAHILGNMWAQHWHNLYDDLVPFKNKKSTNVTLAMLNQNYTVEKMFKITEEFFTSLGLPKLRETFWKNSMLKRPLDRDVVCLASAWDFLNADDYRIKMCTSVTSDDLIIIHHEMGHTHYQMAYEDQPVSFRDGANPGFHEAIGDTIALSAITPDHLYKIGLLESLENDQESDLNFLMQMALEKITFMPFSFLLDHWRWSVFRGDTPPQRYNAKWWELRCRYQGVSPPVERTDDDFDPGSKYHVPNMVSYIRYFVGYVLQFQFHKALCEASGHQGPLHRCDIYNSTAAGDKLRDMLRLGKSKSWPDALEIMTGQRNMDASALMEYFRPLIDWLKIQNQDKRPGWVELACPNPSSGLIDKEEAGRAWLEEYDQMAELIIPEMGRAEWQYATNITDHNEKIKEEANLKFAKFEQSAVKNASLFDWRNFQNQTLQRLFKKITNIGISSLEDEEKLKEYGSVVSEMKAITGRANVCLSDGQCLQIEPGLTKLFAESRNYSLLMEAWEKWRDATGKKMKDKYADMVTISNQALKQLGYEDTGAYWRSWYETPSLEENLEHLLRQLEPLYKNLHAYVRRKLKDLYGNEKFPDSGHIPAHLLGNMWGQQWNNIYDIVEPFKGKPSIDITPKLKELNLKPINLYKIAEEFFLSLGLMEMPPSFWEDSMITKPEDRDVICHASAWDFFNGKDFRIKMCTKVDMEDMMTIHHEMGHIQYFMQYSSLPIPFRAGANAGFHEAVGDVLELSVSSPEHLQKIGLLDRVTEDRESEINFLMSMSLRKIAFLPFGYLLDQWRWSVFNGETAPETYNDKWWELRCKYQGISPPVSRSEDDFDPGAKYHIASNTPYIRYFVSFVLQFQFHKALCEAVEYTGPLHKCDIYQSKQAGKLLGDMLRTGASKPWQDVLEELTGEREMNAEPVMEYFRPLTDWLKDQNRNYSIGWEIKCPERERQLINDTDLARIWLEEYNKNIQEIDAYYMGAHWNYTTNITDYNEKQQAAAVLRYTEFTQKASHNASLFNWKNFTDPMMKKQFSKISGSGISSSDKEKVKEKSNVMAKLESIYATAKACLKKDKCLKFYPDIDILMSTSRNQTQLMLAWRSWREATGRKMKDYYTRFVELSNEGAKENGYEDTGEYWRSWYDIPNFREELVKLLERLKALYVQLHTFVRNRLETYYGREHFPRSGHIPAHLLGNMWAQNWINIYDIVQPFKNRNVPDVTRAMREQNYTVMQMFELADDFFISLNLSAMPRSFWKNSMLERPTDGRDVVCHPSAWDFGNAKDFRIKMCTDVTEQTLQVIHHEMGHIQYYIQYKDQPWVFRRGANPGFHEAVGDVIAMSVETPTHLNKLGLLHSVEENFESDINFLMSAALKKIAFLPFGYLIDQWRWSVFSGETVPDDYNNKWWELRCQYQGVSPPVPRCKDDFDSGAKYHIPGNTPYIRYFISHVIQFQFHKALCEAAGHQGPLHKCDIYQSKQAGKRLGDMLKLGSSKPWQDAMEAITGQRSMSVEPMIEYFQPLIDWLIQQNAGKVIGWSDKCEPPRTSLIGDENLARNWLEAYRKQAVSEHDTVSDIKWKYTHDPSQYNSDIMAVSHLDYAKFKRDASSNASKFNWQDFTDKNLRREFKFIQDIGAAALQDNGDLEKLINMKAEIMQFENTRKVCLGDKYLEPADLQELMAKSRNYSQLAEIWYGWQNATMATVMTKYPEFVQLSNKGVQKLGFKHTGDYWKSKFESDGFWENLEMLWLQIRPLYVELHTYVRKQLRGLYGAEQFPISNQIPAHILGNMWGNDWQNLYDLLKPYKEYKDTDLTPYLQAQNYSSKGIFREAEKFFESIGFTALPTTFWENSTFSRPENIQNYSCDPSVYSFAGEDYRVSLCLSVDKAGFLAAHREIAHIQYIRAYNNQPYSLRDGALPGFHEAVADMIALSVSTPQHQHKIGLLNLTSNDEETSINYLMRLALEKVVFLPYAYIINQWQQSVFKGEITPDIYNEKWWQLRCKYQGLSPPYSQNDSDFYLGSKVHGHKDEPYIRYFVSSVLQFQFLKRLCKAAGHDGPLSNCDIYGSKDAGLLLRNMMELGRSEPWQDILEDFIGQRKLDAAPLVQFFQPLYDWLKEQNKNQSRGWNDTCDAMTIGEVISDWLISFNKEAAEVINKDYSMEWNYNVNITSETEAAKTTAKLERAAFEQRSAEQASRLPWTDLKDSSVKRQFKKVMNIGVSAMKDKRKLKQLTDLQSKMESTYSKGQVCLSNDRCLELAPGLTNVMATSRDYTTLLKVWKGWRDATGPVIKSDFRDLVNLSNEAVRDLGYSDTGEYWRSAYETPTLESDLQDLFKRLSPLYGSLHTYVRKHLMLKYGKENFPVTGHVPAHILGNMWGQSWLNIYDLVMPYKDGQSVDITPLMIKQGYTVQRMFKTAEDFFVSLGLSPLPDSFWSKSMLVKPEGRDVVCHASAWDLAINQDVRVKMCTVVTMDNLFTVHHELGHIYYFLEYEDQPIVYRDGANPGFHEAVGDVILLSVTTPEHLSKIGLLQSHQDNYKSEINHLMMMALDGIAFLPFAYLVDQWRWRVFEGETTSNNYNEKWWELRCKYQGLSPPMKRTESDFDPGAKYHIAGNYGYVGYFVSYILQFQFHKALCEAAGHTGPLHKCDIYRSKQAGKRLRDMLKLGASVPWPDALKNFTGQSKMDVGPLLEYYEPLTKWLQTANYHERPGWSAACPTSDTMTHVTMETTHSSGTSYHIISVQMFYIITVLYQGFKYYNYCIL